MNVYVVVVFHLMYVVKVTIDRNYMKLVSIFFYEKQ